MSFILSLLGIGLGYIIAAALIVGGGYLAFVLGANPLNPLAKLFHYIGMALIGAGILIAAFNYGKASGGADCEARWKAANYQEQINKLARESQIAKESAAAAQIKADDLQQQADAATQKASDYEKTLANRPACALTDDDIRGLRSIR